MKLIFRYPLQAIKPNTAERNLTASDIGRKAADIQLITLTAYTRS